MTRDEILKLEAGRELDALVAEKVMGLVPCNNWLPFNAFSYIKSQTCRHENCYPRGHPCLYSADWGAAGQVAEKMAHEPHAWIIESINIIGGSPQWSATYWGGGVEDDNDMVIGSTAPLAICRAALLAMEAK